MFVHAQMASINMGRTVYFLKLSAYHDIIIHFDASNMTATGGFDHNIILIICVSLYFILIVLIIVEICYIFLHLINFIIAIAREARVDICKLILIKNTKSHCV